MAYLRHMFPNAQHVALSNCIACELHVTLTQHPTNITYMRQHIHTLDLISADYFNFPRLVSKEEYLHKNWGLIFNINHYIISKRFKYIYYILGVSLSKSWEPSHWEAYEWYLQHWRSECSLFVWEHSTICKSKSE